MEQLGAAAVRPSSNRTRRRAFLTVGVTATFVVVLLLAVNLVFGVPPFLPGGGRETPEKQVDPVQFDSGFHFEKGTALSDRSATPSLLVSAKWSHPAGAVCAESGVARAKASNEPDVARFTGAATQLQVRATAGQTYETTVKARRCKGAVKEVVTTGDFVWILHQETAATYSSGWTVGRCRCWSGKSILASKGAGQTATFRSSFTSFGLITDHGRNRGTADIFLDGVKVGSINGYSPRAQTPMQVDFAVRTKDATEHTVLVKVTSGRVDIDAFVTSGPSPAGGAGGLNAPVEQP